MPKLGSLQTLGKIDQTTGRVVKGRRDREVNMRIADARSTNVDNTRSPDYTGLPSQSTGTNWQTLHVGWLAKQEMVMATRPNLATN